MAYLNKMNYKESRNSDGSIFSKGAEVEIMFGPDEVKFDLEKGFERDGLVLLARAFVAKGLQERGTVTAQIDVKLNQEEKKATAPIENKAETQAAPDKPAETSKDQTRKWATNPKCEVCGVECVSTRKKDGTVTITCTKCCEVRDDHGKRIPIKMGGHQ
ncbi:MAG: hypothetical protein WC375_09195 [Methanomassiliicoccales archaeon]|jgi:hypothetical protein